jgi:predicted TIM-barrel fold metal-dependent hydrolase
VPQPWLGIEAVGDDGRTCGIKTPQNPDGKLCTVVDNMLNCNCEPEQLWDVERRLRDMDQAGVDIQVISPAPFLYFYALEARRGLAFAQRINDEIVKVAASRPVRFRAMATAPLRTVDLAVPELERAAGEVGMQGCDGHPLGMIPY